MKINRYRKAAFLLGAYHSRQFPDDTGREVVFAGRSNSGKSSVINTLTGNKALARVSKTPGRTQQINFFTIEPEIRLVDLPGYGYANVPGSVKNHWGKLISAYFNGRKSLAGVVLITDIRRQLTDFDRQMLDWCIEFELPVHVLLNKADKLSYGATKEALYKTDRLIKPRQASSQLFSALKRTGVNELCTILDNWLVHVNPGKRMAPDC